LRFRAKTLRIFSKKEQPMSYSVGYAPCKDEKKKNKDEEVKFKKRRESKALKDTLVRGGK
jgi:hypothetical protein